MSPSSLQNPEVVMVWHRLVCVCVWGTYIWTSEQNIKCPVLWLCLISLSQDLLLTLELSETNKPQGASCFLSSTPQLCGYECVGDHTWLLNVGSWDLISVSDSCAVSCLNHWAICLTLENVLDGLNLCINRMWFSSSTVLMVTHCYKKLNLTISDKWDKKAGHGEWCKHRYPLWWTQSVVIVFNFLKLSHHSPSSCVYTIFSTSLHLWQLCIFYYNNILREENEQILSLISSWKECDWLYSGPLTCNLVTRE